MQTTPSPIPSTIPSDLPERPKGQTAWVAENKTQEKRLSEISTAQQKISTAQQNRLN